MKRNLTKLFVFTSIIGTLLVWSCKGPEGPIGPSGSTGASGVAGANGTQGAKGDTGPMGNANVRYTTWKTPTWFNFSRPTDNSWAYLNVQDTKQPLLTKGTLDSSVIFVYLKTQNLSWDQANQEYLLKERISDTGTYGFLKIPGHTTSNFEDFFQYNFAFNLIGEDFFDPYLQLYTSAYSDSQQKNVPISELVGKNAAYFKDLVKTLPQYRIVVIPGSVKTGRAAAVDFKDYNAVKKAFNIPD
jgi:hypothetical protein